MSEEQDPLNSTMTSLLAEMKKITAQQESGGPTDRTAKAKAGVVADLNAEGDKLSKKASKAAKAKAADLAVEADEKFRQMVRDELHGVRQPARTIGKGSPVEDSPKGRRK